MSHFSIGIFCIYSLYLLFDNIFFDFAGLRNKKQKSEYLCKYSLLLQWQFFTLPPGAPDRIRTYDLPVRSRALYPLSYRRIWSG